MNVSVYNNKWEKYKPTALLILEDGTIIFGDGVGYTGIICAEICFNTALTGYQEILTDPSYTSQIVLFTFPHIGNVGANKEDIESLNIRDNIGASGLIFKSKITYPSNYRSQYHFDYWLKKRKIIGLCGIDTRALTDRIRKKGVSNAIISHNDKGYFNITHLKNKIKKYNKSKDINLIKKVTISDKKKWIENVWNVNTGYSEIKKYENHIIVIDYGVKRNILRLLTQLNSKITIVPSNTSASDIMSMNPDGIVLSNGPGDPISNIQYYVPIIKKLIDIGIPIFGICLGHQILSLVIGGKTIKMHQGHHGSNHPVKNLLNNTVEIVSMNHGFTVDVNTLPKDVEETHISLFDKTNCGIRFLNKPIFSVQYHPEGSPGPHDSQYLFKKFLSMINKYKLSL